jgi:DNA-binding transcriptional LysR family regulator
LDIRFLKTLVAVAEQGSFAAAANAVGLSPSAVSMQIRALEEHLATEIFDRAHRPPVLNLKGLALLPTARKIVNLHDSLRDAAASSDERAGRLRVGVIPTALSSFVPAVLASLNVAHPLLEVQIVTGMNTPLFQLLKSVELDAAIIGEPPRLPSSLRWNAIADELICVIARADLPEENAEALLRAHPYIKLVRGAWQLRLIDEQLTKLSITPRTVMQLDSIEAVALMVYHGLGVSIVPQRLAEPLLNFPLKWMPFGEPPLRRTLGLVSHLASPKQHLVEALHEQIVMQFNRSPLRKKGRSNVRIKP